ncbi:rod shape-determining protein [Streptomyces sp. NPDC058220]|uniref:rod shape-determining protein n=1 Tax=Streptomyces sp. NPDC058220 TaxID=3346387 RepID=UPI0036EFE12E
MNICTAVGAKNTEVRRGLAIDLGSSRTRIWAPGWKTPLDLPSSVSAGGEVVRPVRRGRVVDPAACADMLRQFLPSGTRLSCPRPVVVLSRPVLAGPDHRAAVTEALSVLRPAAVVVIDSARAAAGTAAGAGAGAYDERPLLVVDVGADLLEVTLLACGSVTDARQAEIGLRDLGPMAPGSPSTLVEAAAGMVEDMLRRDKDGAMTGALRRGPLLVGGGAVHGDLRGQLAARLRTPVRASPAPSTAVVRGAASALLSVLRHPGSAPWPRTHSDTM